LAIGLSHQCHPEPTNEGLAALGIAVIMERPS
jgi:hypothetical protein